MIDKITLERVVERLEKLPAVESMSEKDRKFFSDFGSAILENELEYLIKEKKWVLGVIMSASILDFVGKTRLIWKYRGIVSREKIEKFKFATTVVCLFTSKIINKQTYQKMEEIRSTRNRIAHNLIRQFSVSHKPNLNLERLIREAIGIVKTLLSAL